MENSYYNKGLYIMLGNKELRNGKIFCKCFNREDVQILLSILNNHPND